MKVAEWLSTADGAVETRVVKLAFHDALGNPKEVEWNGVMGNEHELKDAPANDSYALTVVLGMLVLFRPADEVPTVTIRKSTPEALHLEVRL